MTRVRALGIAAALTLPAGACAQVRPSEAAGVWQTIDGTKLTIEYSRPRVRGRDPIFGNRKVVRWDEVWTPGANQSTTLDVTNDVTLDGHPLRKGKYSVWLVVRQSGPWTMVLDTNVRRFHTNPPDTSRAALRFPVTPQVAPFTETLTWSFADVRAGGATVTMQWATTRVAIDLRVTPSLSLALPEADARAYVGRYEFTERGGAGKPHALVVTYENGTMHGVFEPDDDGFKRFALMRVDGDRFVPGLLDDQGELYEVLRPWMMLQFTRDGGRVGGYELRDANDALTYTARRTR